MSYATNTGFFVGDSLMDYGFDVYISANVVHLENNTTGGKGIVGGTAPNITDSWDTNWPNRLSTTDFAIIQGGVNDIKSFGILPAAIKTGFQALIDEAITDVGAGNVFVVNIAPWKNHAAWTTTFQTYTDEVNSYLATREGIDGFTLIDMNTALADGVDADALNASYDSGDGIHPNDAGVLVQQNTILSALQSAGVLDLTERMNVYKRWRGAVEPAESGASGNEYKVWRGAVEPAGATVDPSGYYGAVMQLTRGLTEPLVRNVST